MHTDGLWQTNFWAQHVKLWQVVLHIYIHTNNWEQYSITELSLMLSEALHCAFQRGRFNIFLLQQRMLCCGTFSLIENKS